MKNTTKNNTATLLPAIIVSADGTKAEVKRNPNDLIIMNAEVSRNGQKFAYIPVTEIDIDTDYQREQTDAAVDALVAGWNEERYEPIHVAYRDGRFKAWDGGKRLRAQMKMGRENVYCKLCNFDTLKDEITAYIEQGKYVTRISPIDLFKAKLFRGDEKQVMIKRVCDEYGIDIKLNKTKGGYHDKMITNISQFESTAGAIGEKGLRWIFDTLHEMTLDMQGKFGCNTVLLKALGSIYSKPIDSYETIQRKLKSFGEAHPTWTTKNYRINATREYPMLGEVPAAVNLLESIIVGKTSWVKN